MALSCSCSSSGSCPGLGDKTGPVFLGKVLAVTDLEYTEDTALLSSRKAHIQINESFGGLSADVHEVDVLTGVGGGDCGISFQAGEIYLIDTFIGDDGFIHAGICSATRKLNTAGAALRVLRQQRGGQQTPSLIGQIAQHDRNFDDTLGTYPPKPLANTVVRVKANGRAYETQADTERLYAFYSLPSGKYEFIPDLTSGTTLSWYIGSDEPQPPL